MRRSKFFRNAAAFLFFGAIFCGTFAYAGPPIEGEWDTTEGVMKIETLSGGNAWASYGEDGGRIIARLEGSRLSGHWIENTSDRPCGELMDGSRYWGAVQFEFTPEVSVFEGFWGYCQANPTSPWKGKRLGQASAPERLVIPWLWIAVVSAALFALFIFLRTWKKA